MTDPIPIALLLVGLTLFAIAFCLFAFLED